MIDRFVTLRSLLTWAILGGYLLSGLGLPSWNVDLRTGGAFPCEGSRCGCDNAADCWSSCCCTTPRERLAWARANGVTPPLKLRRLAVNGAAPPARQACCSQHASDQPVDDREGHPAMHDRMCHGEPSDWCFSAPAILPACATSAPDMIGAVPCPRIDTSPAPFPAPEPPPPERDRTRSCIG